MSNHRNTRGAPRMPRWAVGILVALGIAAAGATLSIVVVYTWLSAGL